MDELAITKSYQPTCLHGFTTLSGKQPNPKTWPGRLSTNKPEIKQFYQPYNTIATMCRVQYTNVRALTCDQLRDEMKKLFREIRLNRKLRSKSHSQYNIGRYTALICAAYDQIGLLREVYWHQALREKKFLKKLK